LNNFVPTIGSSYTLVSARTAGTSYAGDTIAINIPHYSGPASLEVLTAGGISDLELIFQSNPAPTIYADTLMQQRASFLGLSNAIASRMSAMRGAPSASGTNSVSGFDNITVWVSATGQYRHTSGGDGASGYDSTGGGSVLGIDKLVARATRVGVALAVNEQGISGGNGTSFSGQSGQIQLYGTTQRGVAFLDAQIGGATQQGTVKREISSQTDAQGTLVGFSTGGSVRAGVRYAVNGWNVEPGVTFGAMSLSQNALTESGAAASDLGISRGSFTSVYALSGAEVDRAFMAGDGYTLVTAASAGWLHEMAATTASLSATSSVTTTGFGSAPIGRDAADLALQLELRTRSNLSVFARYETLVDGRSNSQTLQGGVKYAW
jgi:outer membrane autotransporter protein